MKISPINNIYQSFKSNNLGYDDEISSAKRKLIRKDFDYLDIEPSERMEEYDLSRLLNSLFNKQADNTGTAIPYCPFICNLPLYNVKKIPYSDSYRGSMPNKNHDKVVKQLKQAGIKRIIDLAGYYNLKQACEKEGIEYFNFNFPFDFDNSTLQRKCNVKNEIISKLRLDYTDEEEILQKTNSRLCLWMLDKFQYIEQFVKFIQMMQKDNVYIGCECGTYKTDNALKLNEVFNPKVNVPLNFDDDKDFIKFRNLYYNLSDKDKKQMGWDKEFDEHFLSRLKKAENSYNHGINVYL